MIHDPHVHLVAGPLYHSAPGSFALFSAVIGGTVVVMRRFDPEHALHLIQTHRVTSTFMAPALVKRIVDLPESVRARYDVSSMRSLVVGGGAVPDAGQGGGAPATSVRASTSSTDRPSSASTRSCGPRTF